MRKLIMLALLGFSLTACANETAADDFAAAARTFTPVIIESALSSADRQLSLSGYGSTGALNDEQLTIIDMLNYAVQDEYAAYAEYAGIIRNYDVKAPYDNIISAEAAHLDALRVLTLTYGITFPEDPSADHVVIPESLLMAAQTGITAEINNIAMYDRFLNYELPEDIQRVFEALRDASVNHLAAFERQVAKLTQTERRLSSILHELSA